MDDVLLTQSYSIREFVLWAAELHRTEQTSEFIRFALTGRTEDHQAVIDPLRHPLQHGQRIVIKRDFDSLLGVCPDICVSAPLFVYPVARFEDTLSSNIHLDWDIIRGEITHNVPLHQIPNVLLAKWGERHMLRVLFPGLWKENERRKPQLTDEEQRIFLESGILRAVETITPEDISDWPASRSGELWRARSAKGGFALGTRPIADWNAWRFGNALQESLQNAEVDWAEGLLFLHQIRGVKNATHHTMDVLAANVAWNEFLDTMNIDVQSYGSKWWVDVGLEFHVEGSCLQWRTDSHYHIVKDVLRISQANAERITNPASSKYDLDLSAHLTGLSGCRIEPGSRGEGPFQARYLQMYTTDKSVTYHPDGRNFGKSISGSEIIKAKEDPAFLKGLYEAYMHARGSIDSNARIEVRVPIGHVTTILNNFDPQLMIKSLAAVPRAIWWDLRIYRCLAATIVLGLQRAGPARLRCQPDAILLMTAIIWLVNSLHSRPDDGQAARDLIRSILPHTEDDNEPAIFRVREERGTDMEGSIAHAPYGIIFLRDLRLPAPDGGTPMPRFRHGRQISDQTIQYYYNMPLRSLVHTLNPPGIYTSEDIPAERIPTVKGSTPRYVNLENSVMPVFNLTQRGYRLPTPDIDMASDAEIEELLLGREEGEDLDTKVQELWCQFLQDMIIKAPNPRGILKPSYCKLTTDERSNVGEALYKTRKLSEIWTVCQVKVVTKQEWMTNFGLFWPPKDHNASPKLQNFRSCTYYKDWKELVSTLPAETVNAIRRDIKLKVDDLYWLPNATTDKMWNTTPNVPGFKTYPPDHVGAAPRIVARQPPFW